MKKSELLFYDNKQSNVKAKLQVNFFFVLLDFSILKLEKPVLLSSKVNYICLPSKSFTDFSGVRLTISGWGDTSGEETSSDVLKVSTVFGVSQEECAKKYGGEIITDRMLCAAKQGTDTCQGDSGGRF